MLGHDIQVIAAQDVFPLFFDDGRLPAAIALRAACHDL